MGDDSPGFTYVRGIYYLKVCSLFLSVPFILSP